MFIAPRECRSTQYRLPERLTRCAILALALAGKLGCVYGANKFQTDGARLTSDVPWQNKVDLPEHQSELTVDVGIPTDASGFDVSAMDVPSHVNADDVQEAGDGDVTDAPSVQDSDANVDRTLGPMQTGKGSWSDLSGVNNCSYSLSSAESMIAAINGTQYMGSTACGSCLRVTGPMGTVKVRIVDRCRGCNTGDLVLNREAFSQVALLMTGIVNISWQQVPCDVNGPIEYFFKSDSSSSYLSVQIRNHRVPIRSLEVQQAERWVAVTRQDYNFFTSGYGSGPFSFRVTSTDDQILMDTGIELSAGNTRKGAAQFW